MANLNQESFERYAGLAVSAGLLQVAGRSYGLTPAAKEWMRAVDGVLRKGTEVSVALASLSRLTRRPVDPPHPGSQDAGEVARQLVARLAWSELGVQGSNGSVPRGDPPSASRPGGSATRETGRKSEGPRPVPATVPPRRVR